VVISWNSREHCFEAQFAPGDQWAADQQLAKDAGFRTTGAPNWRWQAQTVKPLNYLKEHRPPELTITTEALGHYTRLQKMHETNEAVLAPLKAAKKEAQKKKVKEVREGEKTELVIPQGKWCVDKEDLPSMPPVDLTCYPKSKPFDIFCSVCGSSLDDIWDDRVFLICLYCEK
jgi:hypothetical protein